MGADPLAIAEGAGEKVRVGMDPFLALGVDLDVDGVGSEAGMEVRLAEDFLDQAGPRREPRPRVSYRIKLRREALREIRAAT